jgi:hypothetical protein
MNTERKTAVLHFRVDAQLRAKLERIAAADQRPLANLSRAIIASWVADLEKAAAKPQRAA